MAYNPDLQALRDLKDASLWFIIITILGAVGNFVASAGILGIVSLVLLFVLALPKLKNSFQTFLSTGKDTSYGLTGVDILPWAYIVLIIGGILAVIGIFTIHLRLALVATIVIVIGVLLELIAGIFIGLAIYNLGKFYQVDLMWIGGILVMIPVINFVGWILTYISVDEVFRKLGVSVVPQVSPIPQPSILSVYQVGQGTLSSSGLARFTLNSSSQIQIVSASIDNTTIIVGSQAITPNLLSPGNNQVTIQFPPLVGFIAGNTYAITLVFNNGQSIKVYLVYQP